MGLSTFSQSTEFMPHRGAHSFWYLSEELDVLLEMVDKVRVDLLPGRVHRSQEGDGVHLVQGVEHTCQQTELVSGTNILYVRFL